MNMTPRQVDLAQALLEWRDAGAPVEEIVLEIQQLISDAVEEAIQHHECEKHDH